MSTAWRLLIVAILIFLVGPGPALQVSAQVPDSRYFAETKQTVKGYFWRYWQEHGGLAQQGYPLSGEIQERSDTDGKTYLVQYFERAVFELHNENRAPFNVLLSLVGVTRYKQKHPGGAPNQVPNKDPGTVVFSETGKHLGGAFLYYWRTYGGVTQQGFPISEEFEERSDLNGKVYTVQYFERAVFEFHPENKPPYNVLLSQLGTFRYNDRHQQSLPATPGAPVVPTIPLRDWIEPVNVSNDAMYDNNPSIAVSPVGGPATVGWEQRDDATNTDNVRLATSNSPGEPFNLLNVGTTSFKEAGGVKIRHDALGRRHLVWWEQHNGAICNYYARVEVDGSVSSPETVPNTCGKKLKGTALAVSSDNTVHALFGLDNNDIRYYAREDNGKWTVQGETVVASGGPSSLTLEVSTQGAVMAAYRALAPGGNYDVYTAVRKGANSWAVENISSTCCEGCPRNSKTYLPALAADPSGSGGIRAVWSDEQCDPRSDPRLTDLYYREWLPNRGWYGPPVRIVRDPGEVYASAIVVDDAGVSHIVYESDAGSRSIYRIFYTSGAGTTFSVPTAPFLAWGQGSAYQKSTSMDYSRGWLHIAFNTDRNGSKEVYYSNKQVWR